MGPGMAASESVILQELTHYGFRPAYRSSAVTLLVHPEQPGLEVRVGTTHVVIERDGQEIYRSLHSGFDIQRALAVLSHKRNWGS